MKKQLYFAQMNSENIIFSVVQSDEKPVGENIIEAPGYGVLGKRWTGENFVDRNTPLEMTSMATTPVKTAVVAKTKKKAASVE